MNRTSVTPYALFTILVLTLLLSFGCATTGGPDVSSTLPEPVGPENEESYSPREAAQPAQEESQPDEELELSEQPVEPLEKSDQELLDSALEFCQASYDFRDKGDIENSLDALDQAYALILKISPDADPESLQQRDDLRITISKRIVECYSARFTVANGLHHAIPLSMNRHVEAALNQFKGSERKFFLDAYRRSGIYRPAIVESLREAGLPEELSWLPLIESGFKVRALSRARALGLWQFIASTGYKFGLKRDQWVDERMDPEKATAAAIAYLKELHQIFGDWSTVLAAYNCGEGRVLNSIRRQRINYLDNFWDLYERLPSETAFYVPKFLAVLHILNDPEAHGFTLPEVDTGIPTEVVMVERPLEIKAIAENLDVSAETLEELNPSLRRQITPNGPFAFKVPNGKGALLLAKMEEIPSPPAHVRYARSTAGGILIHKVRRGDSLWLIARKYGTSVRKIAALNGLRSRHRLRVGQRLKVPAGRYASAQAARYEKGSGRKLTYRVRPGDSLWQIARRFRTTVEAIQALNRLADTQISVGQVLRIHGGSTTLSKAETETYRVKKGDSPFQIAQRHQMDLSELLSLNNLTPRSTIFPGQTLLVKVN